MSKDKLYLTYVITGPPTHSVRGQTSNGRWRLSSSVACRRLSSSVTLHGGPAGGFTRAGQAINVMPHPV